MVRLDFAYRVAAPVRVSVDGLGSDPAVPPYTWNLDKDCKADGNVCVAGKCAATP